MNASISNNEIKRIRSLSRKKFRDEYGLFTVEGEKLVDEALRSGFHIEKVYRRDEIGYDTMARISQLATPSPVLAVVRKPDAKPAGVPSEGLYLGLDAVRDPGNLGTLVRIADWFGINAIFASEDTVDVFNPKVVQATMGALFRVKVHYCSLEDTARRFIDAGGCVYGTFLDGEDIYSCSIETGEGAPVMVVMGNESEGISSGVADTVSKRLFIPPFPHNEPGSESLNVAVATAVNVAEFRRRLQHGL